jgi:hypothetical protein
MRHCCRLPISGWLRKQTLRVEGCRIGIYSFVKGHPSSEIQHESPPEALEGSLPDVCEDKRTPGYKHPAVDIILHSAVRYPFKNVGYSMERIAVSQDDLVVLQDFTYIVI